MMDRDVTEPHAAADLLGHYPRVEGRFDELLDDAGRIRPQYEAFIGELNALGPAEMARRSDVARRLVHEQGITYHVYGDPRGMERPWQLDPIPLIVSEAEWSSLERGLVQRATLLNRILADCYGPQELIRSGRLPPALVFSQPDFLRPCHGIRPAQDTFLNLYGADLARSPDGRWWVISDRAQIPTGAGYALQNRLVTARILPESFRDCRVQRIARFFRTVQESLAGLAARRTENPRVVLLTPGPYNETYFEQAYLARYLGFTLVEGQDLTVRDDRVFLKTLGGLEPVDVILRRVDDEFCDPLELRNDSMLGVPGLLGALRAGNVAVANPVGSSLVQSPAFMAFLPGLCRHLLGEELMLPSIATWWGGQPDALEYMLAHLDEVFIKPASRRRHPDWKSPDSGPADNPAELRRRLVFQPHRYVAQERVELATAPCWDERRLVPKPAAVRVYLVAAGDSYQVMPGALTRVASENGARLISMQRGGASKDTWVVSERPVEAVTLLQSSTEAVELRRVGNNLSSRMADNYFWLGRYAERADASSRILRSALFRFSPENMGDGLSVLEPMLAALEAQKQLPPIASNSELRLRPEALEAELLAILFAPDRPGSLREIATQLQRLAMLVRDRISSDTWRILGQLGDTLVPSDPDAPWSSGEAITILNHFILHLASFHGLAIENMTRAQGWRFLDMGHHLERSIYLCSLLAGALRSPSVADPRVLEALLEVADCSITYRSRYSVVPHLAAVFDLLLLDEANPRTLLFQLQHLASHIEHLPREQTAALPTAAQRIIIDCVARLRLSDPLEILRHPGSTAHTATARTIDHLARELPRLSDAIAVSYFAHSAITRVSGLQGPLPLE